MLVAAADAGFEYIRRLVHERSAVVLTAAQSYLADARLMPLAEEQGFRSVREFVDQLRSEPFGRLHQRAVEAMTTNETCFFRDPGAFEALRGHVLPALAASRSRERTLRIWCAACSTGQEPHSIAMLLRESFPAIVDGWNVHILATDLATDVLRRARAGVYSQLEVNRGLPAALLVKYFVKQGLDWHLRDDIRAMVEFREFNLNDPWPILPRMDIVLLRNVLIYFDVETKRSVLAKVHRVLQPDGYLFLGAAETTVLLDDAFERTALVNAGCYRLRSAESVP